MNLLLSFSVGLREILAHKFRSFLTMLAAPKLFSSCAMLPTGEGMAVAVRK